MMADQEQLRKEIGELAGRNPELRRLLNNLLIIIGDLDECHGCWKQQPQAKRQRDAGWLNWARGLGGDHYPPWWRGYV